MDPFFHLLHFTFHVDIPAYGRNHNCKDPEVPNNAGKILLHFPVGEILMIINYASCKSLAIIFIGAEKFKGRSTLSNSHFQPITPN